MSKVDYTEMIGKTAIVTGAAKGYGKEIAKQLIRQGVRVALVDWDLNELTAAANEMYVEMPEGEKIFRALSCPGDINDRDMVKEIVAHVYKYLGGISFVVSAAGEETFKMAREASFFGPRSIVNIIKTSPQAYPLESDVESRKLGIRTNAIRPLMEDSPENEAAVAKAALWLLSSESERISDNSIVMAGI